ncbi:MAG TPA: hypothetical protein VJ756_07695 [Terriglobales bacterium]|nr:hypothetical protein [Terriglobales bacterium]
MSESTGSAPVTENPPATNPARSFTLKASDDDKLSLMIKDPDKFTLSQFRQGVGEFMKKKDRFLNKAMAPVQESDEVYPVSSFAEGDTIFFKRFVEPAAAVAVEPGSYTVKRGSEGQGVKIDAAAHLKDLRAQLGEFMKPADYFMDPAGGKITLEAKYRVAEIADKGVIQIGPTKAQPKKPEAIALPTTDLPPLPTKTWNLSAPGDAPDLLTTKWTAGTTSGQLAAQEYYKTADIAAKKQLFKKLGLDRGFIVKSDPRDPFVQSSLSPAWYVPSDEGPSPSTPAEGDTHRFWAAATRVISEMRKRGINQAAASGSWNDATGLNGVQVRSTYTRDLEEYAKAINSEIHVLEERAVRKVTLTLSNQDLRPTKRFRADVAKIVNSSEPRIQQYARLHSEIFGSYGHFFPTEVVLGGKWIKEYSETSSDTNEQSRLVQEIKAAGDGKGTTEEGTFGMGLAYGNYSDKFSSIRVIQQLKSQRATKTGGAAAASIDTDEGPWVNSLAAMGNWAVIETCKMLPIISLLEGDDAADELRQQCISLINEFATNSISTNNTAVDMEAYVAYLHAREAEKLSLI